VSGKTDAQNNEEFDLTVIIPTYNRWKNLAKVLVALDEQTYPLERIEVVVVSDGSTDETNRFLQEYCPDYVYRPVFQSNQGVAAARNTGLQHARAERVLFLDDDVCPAPALIKEHLTWLHQHENAVILGPMLTPQDTRLLPWVMWEQSMLEKQYNSMMIGEWEPTARQFYTGNTSVDKRQIQRVGGFDPAFTRAEDVELAYRLKDLGMRFFFNPQAIGFHYAERSFESWMGIAYIYGKNDVQMDRQKNQHWLLPKIRAEYHTRHAFVRGLTRLCLDREVLQRRCIGVLKAVALSASESDQQWLARYCFSGIYNLRYYQGIADALGGRVFFFSYLQENGVPGS
jgi:GT2 family glycosyltransferase